MKGKDEEQCRPLQLEIAVSTIQRQQPDTVFLIIFLLGLFVSYYKLGTIYCLYRHFCLKHQSTLLRALDLTIYCIFWRLHE
jgi:hypothetical protein